MMIRRFMAVSLRKVHGLERGEASPIKCQIASWAEVHYQACLSAECPARASKEKSSRADSLSTTETIMAFNGSAIAALLDGAVSKGTLHGVAAVVVDRNGQLFHHAAGEASERTLFRNASMTKAVA